MYIRIISALILLPILLYILINGGLPLFIGVSIVSIMGLKEFYNAFSVKEYNPLSKIGYILSIFVTVIFFFDFTNIYLGALVFVVFLFSCILIVLKKYNVMDLSITFMGIIYITYCLNHIILIKNTPNSKYIWLIFIIAWVSDTAAYFSGYFFGKTKLIPQISPKKTVEGSIGGIVGSTMACILFGFLFKESLINMVIIGVIGSVISQIGDLFASAIKRFLGIKDYGKLIPGHGGILDRFDSIFFTAPFVYYYVVFFVK